MVISRILTLIFLAFALLNEQCKGQASLAAQLDIQNAIKVAIEDGLMKVDETARNTFWYYLDGAKRSGFNVTIFTSTLNYVILYQNVGGTFRADYDLNKVKWITKLNNFVRLATFDGNVHMGVNSPQNSYIIEPIANASTNNISSIAYPQNGTFGSPQNGSISNGQNSTLDNGQNSTLDNGQNGSNTSTTLQNKSSDSSGIAGNTLTLRKIASNSDSAQVILPSSSTLVSLRTSP